MRFFFRKGDCSQLCFSTTAWETACSEAKAHHTATLTHLQDQPHEAGGLHATPCFSTLCMHAFKYEELGASVEGFMYAAGCGFGDLSHRHWNRGVVRHDSSGLSNLQEKECQGYFHLDVFLHARRRRNLGSVWAQYPKFSPRVHQFDRLFHHDRGYSWLGLVRSIVSMWRPTVVAMPDKRLIILGVAIRSNL